VTTASDGVAVIATQLAQTDRRALSEAWYSALHLAHTTVPRKRSAARTTATASPHAAGTVSSSARRALGAPVAGVRLRKNTNAPPAVLAERRRPVDDTARRIERAVATLAARRPAPAAHTIDVAGGRVRLLVHNDGGTTRVVALCNHALREDVERALAGARFTLARAGFPVGAP
jgi:hypothetical protein